jgi:hypothetical protein
VLRIVFAPNRDEITGDWRKFHNEELRNLLHYSDEIKDDDMGGST